MSLIGHRQEDGDYRESWQPQPMSEAALAESKSIANQVTAALGGRGLFGVELFIKGDAVFFSEVSPRPHDTGMVTLISQDLSEFALHARAILGLPVPNIAFHGPSASVVVLVEGYSSQPPSVIYSRRSRKLTPRCAFLANRKVAGKRRMGVALARADSVDEAKSKAIQAASAVEVTL